MTIPPESGPSLWLIDIGWEAHHLMMFQEARRQPVCTSTERFLNEIGMGPTDA